MAESAQSAPQVEEDIPQEITLDIRELVKTAEREAESIIAVEISNVPGLESAAEDLMTIKGLQKKVEKQRTDAVKPLNDKVRAINNWFRDPAAFLERAETTLKNAISAFQHRLEEEDRKAKEAEAKRIEQLAEQRAERAEAKGDTDRAEEQREVAQQSAALTRATAGRAVPKVKGIGTRETYEGIVTDKMALIKAVAEGKQPAAYLEVNMTPINKIITALKEETPPIPGIAINKKSSISARAK